jgi:hypothetical protein
VATVRYGTQTIKQRGDFGIEDVLPAANATAPVPPHRDRDRTPRKSEPSKLDLGAGTRTPRRRITSACRGLAATNATDPLVVFLICLLSMDDVEIPRNS